MKTKIFKKLIAAVCAAAMATSCSVMSVGAVPPGAVAQIDWSEEFWTVGDLYNRSADAAIGIIGNAYDWGYGLKLGCDIEKFLKRAAYPIILGEVDIEYQDALRKDLNLAVKYLKSKYLKTRQKGAQHAQDALDVFLHFIEQKYNPINH